jgi:DNA-binding transcriptional regulator YhcF (GntR family)
MGTKNSSEEKKMSFKLVKRIIHSDRVEGIHKLILIILADYVNETKGNAAWPSVTTVAIQAGTSIRHTRRIIRELETEGVLITTRQAGLRGTNKYVIDVNGGVDTLPKFVPGADTHVRGGADTHVLPGADIQDTKGGHLRQPGADTHVPRIDKEQIRTNTLDRAAPSGRAAAVSLQEMKRYPNGDAGSGSAADTPRCQEHTTLQFQCHKCYAWQVDQWRKEPL